MDTGDLIKKLRTDLGLTQEELGEKIGVQKSAIAKYENGRVENLKRSTIVKLAKVLNTTPSALLGWEEEKEETQQNEHIETIAAHMDGNLTDEDVEEIVQFVEFIKNRKK